jgi:hypothetical protein
LIRPLPFPPLLVFGRRRRIAFRVLLCLSSPHPFPLPFRRR